jgi:hypothetical protein
MVSAKCQPADSAPGEILFVADQPDTDLPARLTDAFPDIKLTDLTTPDHLWAHIADLR